jgi:rhodanese-related sulfurtransferase
MGIRPLGRTDRHPLAGENVRQVSEIRGPTIGGVELARRQSRPAGRLSRAPRTRSKPSGGDLALRRMRLAGLVCSVILVVPGYAGHESGAVALTIQPRELQELLDARGQPSVTVVDLRGSTAHPRARVPGAQSVPAATLQQQLAGLPRTGLLVIYGENTLDALNSYSQLKEAGFRNVRALAGGFGQWSREGRPVELR